MKMLGSSLLASVACVAIAAACEQQIVVVEREGGGGSGGDDDGDYSAEYVASSSVGTTVATTGAIVACGNAPGPQGQVTQCDSVAATSSGTAMLCLSCAQDDAGQQYFAQCLGKNCRCSVGETDYCLCEVQSEACGESCCPEPWVPFQ